MSVDTLKTELKQLMSQKQQLEQSIELQHTAAQPDQPLIDSDGYPRSDIDIHSIRIARHTLIQQQNDHKQLMKQIDEKMLQYHALLKQQPKSDATQPLNIGITTTKPIIQPASSTIKLTDMNTKSNNGTGTQH